MFHTKIVQQIKTHILCSATFLKNHFVYEIMRNGGAGQATDGDIMWRMCCACWITKATNKLRICNTYCFSTATMVAGTCHNVILYIHCLSC